MEARAVDPGLLVLAEGLASFAGPQDPESLQRTILVCLLVLAAQAEGHSGLPLSLDPGSRMRDPGEGPGRGLSEDLAHLFRAAPEALAAHLDTPAMAAILGRPLERKPLVLDHGTLSTERVFRAEERLAAALAARAAQAPGPGTPIDPELLEAPRRLNPEQIQAVRQALVRPLTLITGGPGTGKTSIVVAILRAALRQPVPPRVALAAPTGKAANRMHGSIQDALAQVPVQEADAPLRTAAFAPRTLHRLLGCNPGQDTWRHHEDNPLPADLVVVDEASMVDLALMDRLVRAVPPGARLVLLGDADQLPSVETGRVFQDLAGALDVVRLATNYRMDQDGRPILAAARKIVGGSPRELFQPPDPILPHTPQARAGVDLLDPGDGDLRRFLLDWLHDQVEHHPACPDFLARIGHVHAQQDGAWQGDALERLDLLFAHAARARILCPLKTAPALRGADSVNTFLHAQASAARDRRLTLALAVSLGEPVMMTRNDPRRGIYNGDQGLALKVARDGGLPRLEAVFPCAGSGYQAHAIAPLLHELELGYALTVHKAQGSEYQRVAVILPREDSPFLSREILYTALTRARRHVTLVGSREQVERAAERVLTRHSTLPDRLREALGTAH
jgi:exodeoxyribonuclease V alpha subunit